VTATEVKNQTRIDFADDDTLIATLIQAATDQLDAEHGVLGRALINQTWRLNIHGREALGDYIELPFLPVSSVTEVKYIDVDGAEQTFAASNYRLVAYGQSARLELVSGATWPGRDDRLVGMWVDYVAGYGATSASIPDAIRVAALKMIAHWYDNRGAMVSKQYPASLGVSLLLQPFYKR